MGPVEKFEIVNVRDSKKNPRILVFRKFKNEVKLILYLVHWETSGEGHRSEKIKHLIDLFFSSKKKLKY